MPRNLTPTEAVGALRAAHGEASGDRWHAVRGRLRFDDHGGHIGATVRGRDAVTIALAHNTMVALLDVVEAAQDVAASRGAGTGQRVVVDVAGLDSLTAALTRLATVVGEEVSRD